MLSVFLNGFNLNGLRISKILLFFVELQANLSDYFMKASNFCCVQDSCLLFFCPHYDVIQYNLRPPVELHKVSKSNRRRLRMKIKYGRKGSSNIKIMTLRSKRQTPPGKFKSDFMSHRLPGILRSDNISPAA